MTRPIKPHDVTGRLPPGATHLAREQRRRRNMAGRRYWNECAHGLTFDSACAAGLPVEEVRRRWPRLDGACPLGCSYHGVAYASPEHLAAGAWRDG